MRPAAARLRPGYGPVTRGICSANLDKEPSYATVNTGGEHRLGAHGPTLRLDIVNLFDHRYQFRDGSGLGISAAQWVRRRSVFVGVAQTL